MIKNRINSIWLIAILSAIFIGCKKEDLTVGSNFQDEEGVFEFTTLTEDDLDISFSTQLDKSTLEATDGSLAVVGKFDDDAVVDATIHSYLQLGLLQENPDFGDNPVCLNAWLYLGYAEGEVTDRYVQGTGVTEINVKRMTEFFSTDASYLISRSFGTDDENFGSVQADGSQDADSVAIPLSADFGDDLIALADGKSFDDFILDFEGLKLEAGDLSTMISSFDPEHIYSRLLVYYVNDSGDDTLSYEFNLGNNDLVEHVEVISSTDGDFSGLDTEDMILSSTETGNSVALASGAGLNTLITFNDIQSVLDTLGEDVIINAAYIELPVNQDIYMDGSSEAPIVLLGWEADETGAILTDSVETQLQLLPNDLATDGAGADWFSLDQTNFNYKLDLTYYVQEVIWGTREFNSLLITPDVKFTSVNYNRRFRRTSISTDEIKFRLFYSQL